MTLTYNRHCKNVHRFFLCYMRLYTDFFAATFLSLPLFCIIQNSADHHNYLSLYLSCFFFYINPYVAWGIFVVYFCIVKDKWDTAVPALECWILIWNNSTISENWQLSDFWQCFRTYCYICLRYELLSLSVGIPLLGFSTSVVDDIHSCLGIDSVM